MLPPMQLESKLTDLVLAVKPDWRDRFGYCRWANSGTRVSFIVR